MFINQTCRVIMKSCFKGCYVSTRTGHMAYQIWGSSQVTLRKYWCMSLMMELAFMVSPPRKNQSEVVYDTSGSSSYIEAVIHWL